MNRNLTINKLNAILLILISISSLNCNNKDNELLFLSSQNDTCNYKVVTYKDLLKQNSFYNNKCIEVKGLFYNSMEEQSLNNLNHSTNAVKESFWIDFEEKNNMPLIEVKSKRKLLGDGYFLDYLTGKPIIIKGTLNMLKHGHLGQYIGTIENVTYIKL